ncbi:MAG: histidine kinase [Verrucomicrobia bacterium]|nr:histidine kinase [Deltaproteobacteria bacterium]
MSLKKTVAIAAAVGAMAAISVPAMALENEFHGSYTFNTIFSNFQDGGSGDFNPNLKRDKLQMNNYFEQRGRIQYTAKVSDDLKFVTHFEINNRFGNINTVLNSQGGQTDVSGSDLDADGLNLVTKHVYLDFNLGSNFNTKLGIQPYRDTIKGLFIDADIPAVMTATKLGAYTLGLGFSRFDDTSTGATRLGDLARDLFIMDNTFAFTKDTKAALSYYLLADYRTPEQARLINTLGASAETKLGPLTLSGFAAIQAGHQKHQVGTGAVPTRTSRNFHGYAANVAAKLAVGPGTAKTAFLFVSGNNNAPTTGAHDRGWVSTGVNSYNESGLMILVRNTANSPTSTDRYLRKVITNVAVASMGYDANLTDKIYANGNVGFAWVPASNQGSVLNPKRNASDFLGTEFNLETGYKVNSNLTLRAQAAYAILGGYYKDAASNSTTTALKDPENPYTARLFASFKF